jgi:hypothetical protein
LRFAEECANVLAVDNNFSSAEETVALARQTSGECVAFQADAAVEATLVATIEAARTTLGARQRPSLQCWRESAVKALVMRPRCFLLVLPVGNM